MKRKFYKIVSLIMFLFLLIAKTEAQRPPKRPGGSSFLAGAEFQFERLGSIDKSQWGRPDTIPDTVLVKLYMYKSCDFKWTNPTYNPINTAVTVVKFSNKCCDYTVDTLVYDPKFSEQFVSPLCALSVDGTRCASPLSNWPGYQTEVFTDTIILKCKADDWRFGFLYSSDDSYSNFYPFQGPYNAYGLGSAEQQLNRNPWVPPPPLGPARGNNNPFKCRLDGPNTIGTASIEDQAFLYIEAMYSNNVVIGFTNSNPPIPKTIANTSPISVASPLIFQCKNVKRSYDLGYYDVDGNYMTFEPTPIFKDVIANGTSNNLTTTGKPLDFASGFSYDQPFGSLNGSFYHIDTFTGVVSFACNLPLTKSYKTGIKIKEYDVDPKTNPSAIPIGEVTRDIVITIIDHPSCLDSDFIANSTYFIDNSLSNFSNCRVAPNRVNTVEACAGSKIGFSVAAYSNSKLPGASILISKTAHPTIQALDSNTSLSMTYFNNTYPTLDTALANFTWDIPDSVPPGRYWVMFQVNSCIGPYTLSRSYIVYIRINDKTEITSNYANFVPTIDKSIFNFPNTDSVSYCDAKMSLELTADNKLPDGLFVWTDLTSGVTSQPVSQNPNLNDMKYNAPVISDLSDLGVQKIMVTSNQYCNNTDTLTIVNHMTNQPTLISSFKDTCLNTVGTITINNLPNRFLMDWQIGSSLYSVEPSYFSNVAKPIVKKINNNYDVYAYFLDYKCPFSLNASFPAKGIKPKGKYTYDRSYVCPLDTIKAVQLKMTTAICGARTNYSHIKPGLKIAQFNSNESNVDSVPKIFTSTVSIDRTRTQILYRAADLRKNGFKAGVIEKIGFNILGINSPLDYNNVDIRVTCTDRTDLQNLKFEDTSSMIKIASLPTIHLSTGWNLIPLGTQFTWDDSTNLIFEFTSSCNFPAPNITPVPPAYVDRQTNYIASIGQYGKGQKGYDGAQVVGSTYSPDIRFEYYELGDSIEYKWTDVSTTPANLTIISNTSKEPKFVGEVPRNVLVEFRNGECFGIDTLPVIYDTNFSIKLDKDSVLKCPGDTIQMAGTYGVLPIRPMNLVCGTNNTPADTCRIYDKKTKPYFGNATINVGNATVSPFGGTGGAGTPVTDKRLQFIIPLRELKTTLGMTKGLIDSVTFIIPSLIANSNGLNNFSIKMKCIPPNMESINSNNFESIATFDEIFTSSNYTPKAGDNSFKLSRRFAWDGNSGLMFDICFDNPTGVSYNSNLVKGSTTTDSLTLYAATATGDLSSGCNFLIGNKLKIRPDIKLSVCAATRPMPPIPASVAWAPTTYINNTSIYNPILYNISTTDYYILQRYIDTNYGQNKVVCIVRDTFISKVNRPLADFNKPIACEGDSAITTIGIKDTLADNLYTYVWDTTQIGVSKTNYINPAQAIFPNNPGYYKVYFYETAKPNCYNLDSVYVDIQKRSIMPNIGGPSQFCYGDTIQLSIPTSIGYRKPVWVKNNNYLDTGYAVLVADTGTFVVYIDSGVCRNYSNSKTVAFRPIDTTKIVLQDVTMCQGDTAVLYYNLSAGISNPIWNNGSTDLVLKVTQAGIYYIVNPRTQYGCLYQNNDTAKVEIIDNPNFSLNSDTLCLSANSKVILQPTPYDADATYTWQPVNYVGSSYEATLPGEYTVIRSKGNCLKQAKTFVVNDTPGTLNLGRNMAICCDEVITLNANPLNLEKYKAYKWSTDERSQFIYTKPNSSGKYIVEAYKANGCRDTGSIFIKSLCANVTAKVKQPIIQIGEVNPIIATFDTISNAQYTYTWKSPDAINQVVNPSVLNAVTKPGDTGDVEYILTMQISDSSYMPPKSNCIENASVRYWVKPNGINLIDWFSPNQDGVRDVYWPVISGNVKITDFKVYNRFGQLIHNETIPWDGKFKGEPQPIGAYVGLISYELNAPRQTGQITHKQISISLFR